jgi:chromosome segregation ATPase
MSIIGSESSGGIGFAMKRYDDWKESNAKCDAKIEAIEAKIEAIDERIEMKKLRADIHALEMQLIALGRKKNKGKEMLTDDDEVKLEEIPATIQYLKTELSELEKQKQSELETKKQDLKDDKVKLQARLAEGLAQLKEFDRNMKTVNLTSRTKSTILY